MRQLISDKYYGDVATGYDAKREGKPGWQREQKAVESFVTEGPVLDVPVGTGRYFDIYKSKGLDVIGIDISEDMLRVARSKHPSLDARIGSVFDIPFPDQLFRTSVCSRLLNWLQPDDMDRAVQELRRVSNTLVVSIRTGPVEFARPKGNLTHSLDRFHQAIDGLMIEERCEINKYDDGTFEMFKLRPVSWEDVYAQFAYHKGHQNAIGRLAKVWFERLNLGFADIKKGQVSCEYWTDTRFGELIDKLASVPRVDGTTNRMKTDEPPRFMDGPATVIRVGDQEFMIDGRRRANQWRKNPGRYPVLVISVEPTQEKCHGEACENCKVSR